MRCGGGGYHLMRFRPRRSACPGLRLAGVARLLNMETTSSAAVPRAAPGPVRLTLNVRPGGAICRAAIIHHDYLTEQEPAASAAALHLLHVCLKSRQTFASSSVVPPSNF